MMSLKSILAKIVAVPVILVLVVILSPIILGYFVYTATMKVYVRSSLSRKWPNEKYILFIYSESENWSPYIREHIIPAIEPNAVIINRTKQSNWKQEYALEKRALALWANIQQNPVAIVFGQRRPKAFLFFEGFRDLKHGKEERLKETCNEFYSYASLSSV